ncbi:MAG: murein L,D-transpeptidase [Alphaproteobacteria bacterium]|nr:MAG: murein L,D-transpeptidase [Alphaproteobacteria bacterium]
MVAARMIRRVLLVGSFLWAMPFVAAVPAAAQDIAAAIEERLDLAASAADGSDAAMQIAELRQFYADRAFEPLWIEAAGASARAKALAAALAAADQDGLDPNDYAAPAIAARLDAQDPAALAELEVLMSRAVARYAADQLAGRTVPTEVDSEMRIEPDRPGAGAVLLAVDGAPDLADYLASFAPRTPNYQRLKEALAAYRAVAAAGGWRQVPEGPSLKPGMSDPRVPILRERLIEAGDLSAEIAIPPEAAELYDPALEAAVKRFQWRHGLTQDGVAGKKTVAAMNVPVEARIEQMLLNMERRRWMPDDLGERYVFVNMADFELKVVDGPRTIHDSRVVVGTPYHRTPVFSGMMTYVVLNPYWNITPSIARNEILPKLRKDASYLERNNIVVLSDWSEGAVPVDPDTIDWSQVSSRSFPYKLRQEPGEQNALGRIKFMFPNPYNIYLHDTPSRQLFRETVRSFSHGCIRVEHPVDFGAMLLEADGWTKEKLDAAIATGAQKVITLRQPIPVHLTYLTAWVNKDGSIHFRDDIYGRDKLLAEALLPDQEGI